MRLTVPFILCVALVSGCVTTRSISNYQYGYNTYYRGELSEVEFIKDISDPQAPRLSAPIQVAQGEKVIVIQSGQLRPDAAFLSLLAGKCSVVPMSGVPSLHSVGGPTLREAAKAGGVVKVIAYWGSIQTAIQPKGAKAISWVPVAGWYIPDESQKMRVSVSAIIGDVATGQWSDVTAVSSETETSHSSFNLQATDSRQVEELKADAYSRLLDQLVKK